MPADKRKHGDLSSTSDLEASINNSAEESIPAGDKEKEKNSKSQKKKESKKPKTGSDDTEKSNQEGMAKRNNMQDNISEINKKLSQIITKDDNSFTYIYTVPDGKKNTTLTIEARITDDADYTDSDDIDIKTDITP